MLCLVWSSAFVAVKLALRDAPAPAFAALRTVGAVPPLLLALVLRDAAGLRAALRQRRVHALGAVLGAVYIATFLALQTAGFALAGVGFGAVLIYAQPLLVALLGRAVLGERLRPRQVAGLLTGWAGVALAVLGELTGAGDAPVGRAAMLFLGAAVCFAVGTVVVKARSGPCGVPLAPALLLALTYGSVPLVALALADDRPVHWTGTLLLCTAYTAGVSTAGGYLLQFALLQRGEAGVVSSYMFAVPVLAAAYGVVVFDERLSSGLVLGGAAVAVGILLVTVPARAPAVQEGP